MGYDQPERSNSSGAIVAVMVAVLLVVILGGLFVAGVGTYFWLGTKRVQQKVVLAERDARMQAEQAKAMAEQALIEAEAQRRRAETLSQRNLATDTFAASLVRREFELSISQDGSVRVDGQQIDLAELRARLQKIQGDSDTPVSIQIEVGPECPHEHLIAILDACQDVTSEVTFRMSPSSGGNRAVQAERVEP